MDDEAFVASLKLDFDPDALRKKYKQERERRLRDDGNAQYEKSATSSRMLPTTPMSSPALPALRSQMKSMS